MDNTSKPLGESWNSDLKGSLIALSNSNKQATSTRSSHGWNSVYGTKSYAANEGGIYEWKIKVLTLDNGGGNSWELILGVAHSYDEVETDFTGMPQNPVGYGYIQENGRKTKGSSSEAVTNLDAYTEGDTITIRLDLKEAKISFAKNEGDLVVTENNIPKDEGKFYRLAASIGDDRDKIEILSHRVVEAP